MSFFRRAISPAVRETVKFNSALALGLSGWSGCLLGWMNTQEHKLPFPEDVKVIAKSAGFGMFKFTQYAAYPITYSLPKTLAPDSNLGYLMRTSYFELVENAAKAEKSKLNVAMEAKETERPAISPRSLRG